MNENRAELLRPLRNPAIRVDLRALLVRAIEQELDARCGGNAVLNRLEAEAQLDRFLSTGRGESRVLSQRSSEEIEHATTISAHRGM